MTPQKLKAGDEIRVIAPSTSMAIISQDIIDLAAKRLGEMGLKVTYAKNVLEKDEFMSSSIKSRVDDLHEAFLDKNVKGILTVLGGLNVNQILTYIDYDLITKNPKVLCGFSDITALSNAIYAKTGLVNYSGPHFSTFGMGKGIDYTKEHFKKALFETSGFELQPSSQWSDDMWFLDQEKRKFIDNKGHLIINQGQAEGKILGSNLCTFNLLQGTEFFPNLSDSILFIEDDEESNPRLFDRDLQSLIHQPNFSKVRGIVIGRFQKKSEVRNEQLTKIIKTKKELNDMPVVANVNFGHTTPQFTFPIGGKAKLRVDGDNVELSIV